MDKILKFFKSFVLYLKQLFIRKKMFYNEIHFETTDERNKYIFPFIIEVNNRNRAGIISMSLIMAINDRFHVTRWDQFQPIIDRKHFNNLYNNHFTDNNYRFIRLIRYITRVVNEVEQMEEHNVDEIKHYAQANREINYNNVAPQSYPVRIIREEYQIDEMVFTINYPHV